MLKNHKTDVNLSNFICKKYLEKLDKCCTRKRVFTSFVTMRLFISQILEKRSCKEVLLDYNLERLKDSEKPVSLNSAAYSRAKSKLDEKLLKLIAISTGKKQELLIKNENILGSNTYFIDGTLLSLEETRLNRQEYPSSTKNGLPVGYPKLRLLAAFSGTTGAFIDGDLGKYSGKLQSEVSLFKKLVYRLPRYSTLIMDRFFTSYELQSLTTSLQMNYVIRARDKFAIKCLSGAKEKVVKLKSKTGDEISIKELAVRFIKSTIKRKGYRPATLYIMTSILDKPAEEIEQLYLSRWNVELDIRNLKTTLQSEHLKSKLPNIARKELWIRLIAYNLIRRIIVNAGLVSREINYLPRRISFKGALVTFTSAIKKYGNTGLEIAYELISKLLLAKTKYRREPRAVKKRQNKYWYLTGARKEMIKKMIEPRRRANLSQKLVA